MCGRYLIISSPEAIRQLFRYPEQPNFPARYNVAPTQPIPIVRLFEGQRQFALVRWGLIPAWVKDPRTFSLLVNARGESVNDKPAYRNAMKRRRCLVPADGFYDWKEERGRRRPHVVRPKNREPNREPAGGPIAFAGLWECWMGPNGEEMETCAIITTQASRDIAHIHDRMPVIVPPDAFDFWLDCTNVDAMTAAALIAPSPAGLLEVYEVSSAVNHAANDSPALIEPLAAGAEPPAPSTPQTGLSTTAKRAKKRKEEDDRQSSLF
jgi:putative SOS response-associated peptidase YedK